MVVIISRFLIIGSRDYSCCYDEIHAKSPFLIVDIAAGEYIRMTNLASGENPLVQIQGFGQYCKADLGHHVLYL